MRKRFRVVPPPEDGDGKPHFQWVTVVDTESTATPNELYAQIRKDVPLALEMAATIAARLNAAPSKEWH